VYWGAFGSIGRAGNDGSAPQPEFIKGIPGFVCGVAVDSGHIYWGDYNLETIGRANIDGSQVESEFIKGAHHACGVAVSSSHVYWTSPDGYVGFANIDGSAPSVTATPGSSPCGIAVDSGYAYYVAHDGSAYKIYRAGLNSPAVKIDPFAATPTGDCGLALGPDQRLYWTNGGFDSSKTSGLWSVGNSPSSPSVFLAPTEPEPWSVAVEATYAYWTTYNGGALNRVRVDGTQPPEKNIVTGIHSEAVGLAVDARPLPAPPVEPPSPGGEAGGGSQGSGGGGSGSTAPPSGAPTPTPPPAKVTPKPKKCKEGFRRKLVKGKKKCVKVKVQKHKHRRHHRHA
jgi:hypothetical protein